MALDERFILDPNLQDVFRDKDTGLPLRDGYILFFEDKARTIPKEVYTISGTPPNYTYTSVGVRVNLNSAGYIGETIGGTPINQLYYFPFDGNESTTTGAVDLYFIEIYNSDDVLQGTREAWPNTTASSAETEVDENFIPNGQLLLHTDLPETPTEQAGEIRAEFTDVAYGGYEYVGPSVPTGQVIVSFDRFGSFTANPEKSPRYAIKIEKNGTADETIAELRIVFDDVNKFASATDEFTLKFSASSQINTIITSIEIVKNFGTGGSPSPEQRTPIASNIALNAGYQPIVVPGFVFGDNTLDTLGLNDDDFVAIAITFPTTTSFEVSMTDFLLTEGDIAAPVFEYETDRDFIRDALGGGFPVPAYDGSDIGLPALLTKDGWTFDSSQIGKVFMATTDSLGFGELACDGARYDPADVSADGIPYSRLFGVIGNRFGTGEDYTAAFSHDSGGPSDLLFLAPSTAGPFADPANGAMSPGFTYDFGALGEANTYFVKTGRVGAGSEPKSVLIRNTQISDVDLSVAAGVAPLPPADGAIPTGFTFTVDSAHNMYEQELISIYPASEKVGTGYGQFVISNFPATAAALAGTYFEFDSINAGVRQQYYVWFTVDGAGADPAVAGRTGIQIGLNATDSDSDIRRSIAVALNGRKYTCITVVDGSTIAAGSFFIFDCTAGQFYVWYEVDSVGTDPAPAGRIGIKSAILSTDNETAVVSKTANAINTRFFAVPDLRGAFIRGYDPTGVRDTDSLNRTTFQSNLLFGSAIGTEQMDEVQQHNHEYFSFQADHASGAGQESINTNGARTGLTGGLETRPRNTALQYIIKY